MEVESLHELLALSETLAAPKIGAGQEQEQEQNAAVTPALCSCSMGAENVGCKFDTPRERLPPPKRPLGVFVGAAIRPVHEFFRGAAQCTSTTGSPGGDSTRPARVAIVDDADGRSYTYGELESRAVRVADHLHRQRGIVSGGPRGVFVDQSHRVD